MVCKEMWGIKMLWKIYFWIMLVLLIASMFLENEYGLVGTVLEIVSMIISIISTVGFYGYVYEKQFFPHFFWKVIFIIALIDVIVTAIYYGFKETSALGELIFVTIFTFIVMYPLLLGLYRYGFKKQKMA
ncbi:hypothetical protein HMPREF9372_3554 [Sporosarcina newyorkensis 2681]|uniref:Integral membrane protein n=1 Tax=Sporosarcina newyorkensis 2681 TaxID=1027292 RepID=F9DXM3_9BACL|nr:hypothetical protein [Sporosarcina newyorkensis]EGQ20297.1 hypothetical protein HMPREF9372_3554 [Sporosarcina newyorkensis 2681]